MNTTMTNGNQKFRIWWQVQGCEPDTTDVTFDDEEKAQRACDRLNEVAEGDYIKYWVEPVQ